MENSKTVQWEEYRFKFTAAVVYCIYGTRHLHTVSSSVMLLGMSCSWHSLSFCLNPLLKIPTFFCEDSKRPVPVCIHWHFMPAAVEPWSWFMSLLHWSHGLLSFRAMSHLIDRPVALWQTPSVRKSTSEWPHPLLISSSIIPIESCQVSCHPCLLSTSWPTDSPIR